MIYGIGNDLLEIDRIKKSLNNPRFSPFCFSRQEQEAFGDDARKLAGCFAAKEALGKALGTGVRGFELNEVSVLRNEAGAPYFTYDGKIREIIHEHGLTAHIALTNTDRYVMAMVVLEVKE